MKHYEKYDVNLLSSMTVDVEIYTPQSPTNKVSKQCSNMHVPLRAVLQKA